MARKGKRKSFFRPLGYVSPKEAAKYFGCTSESVKNWIYAGKLRGTRDQNGFWWIRETDLRNELGARGLPGPPRFPSRDMAEYSMKPFEINLEAAMEFGFDVKMAKPAKGFEVNLEAAKEFGFRIEKARPKRTR